MQEAIDVGYDDSLDNASIHSWVWTPHPEEEEIVDSRWIKINQLVKFDNEELREPGVLKQIIDNLLKEKIYSISIYNKKLGK